MFEGFEGFEGASPLGGLGLGARVTPLLPGEVPSEGRAPGVADKKPH